MSTQPLSPRDSFSRRVDVVSFRRVSECSSGKLPIVEFTPLVSLADRATRVRRRAITAGRIDVAQDDEHKPLPGSLIPAKVLSRWSDDQRFHSRERVRSYHL
jgi:hypothetical protein